VPEKITIDGSAANEAAITSYNEAHGTAIVIRKVTYLNNIVEQAQRAVKRVTRPMLGFQSFEAAQSTLTGIEIMQRIKKRQRVVEAGEEDLTAAAQCYTIAASSPYRPGQLPLHNLFIAMCDTTSPSSLDTPQKSCNNGGKGELEYLGLSRANYELLWHPSRMRVHGHNTMHTHSGQTPRGEKQSWLTQFAPVSSARP